MNTPIRQLVKKTLSPRIFKSPNASSRLNIPIFTSDLQTVKSPSTTKCSQFSESVKSQTVKYFEAGDFEYCRSNSPNSRCLTNRLDEFIIHKPNKLRRKNSDENQNDIEVNHSLLLVPNRKDVPSVNTPEREEFLKADLSKLNLNVLGKGSFGTVVQATYKGKDVALKIIRSKNTSLVLEANALNLLHPNILHVLLVANGTGANHHLVVMQRCCVQDMQSLLDSSETDIPFTDYTMWVLDICSALQYCHQHDILHLDVKPKNILMKNNTCVLCDFGNSLNLKSLEQKKHYLLERSEGPGGGTVAYSAPELLHGVMLPTAAADVYALAVTMHHVHTRTPPFHHLDNVHSVIYQVVKHNLRPAVPPEQSISCDCARLFRSLYMRCWAQAPHHRPTLRTVSDSLQQAITRHQNCICSNCSVPSS